MIRNGASAWAAKAFSRSKSRRCSTWRGARREFPIMTLSFRLRRFVVRTVRSFRYSRDVQTLVEDFLQYLRHERGQSDNTVKTYAALLGKFTAWAEKQNLSDWKQAELKHLMAFLQH